MRARVQFNYLTYGDKNIFKDYKIRVMTNGEEILIRFYSADQDDSISNEHCRIVIPSNVAKWLGEELIVATHDGVEYENNKVALVNENKNGYSHKCKIKTIKTNEKPSTTCGYYPYNWHVTD